MKKITYNYDTIWFVFANFTSLVEGNFNELIVSGTNDKETYIGAWSYLIIRTNDIKEVCEIAELGLAELGFELRKIETIENFAYMIEYNNATPKEMKEVRWLLRSRFVFKIFDKISPYIE